MKRAVLALALALASPVLPSVSAESLDDVQISRFSNKPVPRFESLRHEKVNGRIGPGKDYGVRWEYLRRGLPVLILKESGDWRYVRDHAGDEVWIEKTQLSDTRKALTLGTFALKAGRASDSRDLAAIGPDVLVELGECEREACRVTAGKYRGWAPRAQLWGADATKG